MSPWERLGVDPGASEPELKRAYARLLKQHRPDEDPVGFQALHEAYRTALDHARRRAAWASEVAAKPSADDHDDATQRHRADAGDTLATDRIDALDTPATDRTDALDTDVERATTTTDATATSDGATPAAEQVAHAELAANTDLTHEPSTASIPPPPTRETASADIAVDRDTTAPADFRDSDAADEADDADDTDDTYLYDDEDPDDPDWDTSLGTITQPVLPIAFIAPLLRQLLAEPNAAVDPDALHFELGAALAGLDPEQRRVIAQRVAVVIENAAPPPAAGVVSVLAETLDWDAMFLRHRSARIAERLAADEAHAALQRRLRDPASGNRPLRALAMPPQFLRPTSWPLWLSTHRVQQELSRIALEVGANGLALLDPAAVKLTQALSDHRRISLARISRWLALAGAVGLAVLLLVLLLDGVTALTAATSWTFAGATAALVFAAAYLRARVLQVYALPLELARQLWLIALLLGLLLLAHGVPALHAPLLTLVGLATASIIGSPRLLPGMLAFGATVMFPAAAKPLFGALPDLWLLAALVLLASAVLVIDYIVARQRGWALATVRAENAPLYGLGIAIFIALLLVGAVTEDSRKPIPARPTHSA